LIRLVVLTLAAIGAYSLQFTLIVGSGPLVSNVWIRRCRFELFQTE
jgi:hypothetical protein